MIIQQLLGPNGLICAVEGENQNINILWGGRIFYSYNRKDTLAKKLGIMILNNVGVMKKTISEVFEINRRTVTRVIDIYDKEGMEGLNKHHQGPQRTEEALKVFVIEKYIELDNKRGYQKEILEAIKQKVEEGVFYKFISRSKLRKIILEHKEQIKNGKEEARKKAIERQNREKKKRIEQQNLEEEERNQLKFPEEEQQYVGGVAVKESLPAEQKPEDTRFNNSELAVSEMQNREEKKRTKQQELEEEERSQLKFPEEEQQCVQHGGGAAVIPLLQGYGLKEFLPTEQESEDTRFNNSELAVSYAILNAGELVTVEQDFKLLDSYQIGGIIGRVKLPSLSLYRNRIPKLVAHMDMRKVILQTAKQAHCELGFSKVVYIDGHFMPYYGASAILYGYYPQKRLAMHGREYFFVHDENGLPVYATISDGYRKMQHYIKDIDEKIREIYGVRKKELLEVFDRGGYSKTFCIEIAQRIRFICWRSDAKVVPEIPENEWEEVVINHQPNEYSEVKEKRLEAWERQKEFSDGEKKAKFREIWIKSKNKISPALTNDFRRSLPEAVAALTRRWGAQENMFKGLKNHGIDRIHSYQKEEYTEEFLYCSGLEEKEEGICHEIENPKFRKLNKKISELRNQKLKLDGRIAELKKKGKEDKAKGVKDKSTKLEKEIADFLQEREHLPKKVKMMDRIKKEQIVRLSSEKKLFFDWLKMNGIWAKRKLVEIVKPYYKDLRDVNKFIRALLRSRTYVTKKHDVLYVSFPPQRSKKSRLALEAICEYLNIINSIDLNLSFSRINFRVGQKH